ncbi:VWA domain-containing protein [Marinobacter bohaiensis]|uniref:VWA domain-containing protein n=1 Tax=Marinobacter bohaiensis TaxID=2201898 RepID=UPI000DAC8B09|nr:VWA domain-containing protein [Marinobacter bohaiensis]
MTSVFRFRAAAILLAICLCVVAGVSRAQQASADTPQLPPAKDVRIVVDISGSMKDSDPKNLRQPAVRLLARLLPDDARSGVWTFGQYVNMLVPSAEVSPDWRDTAIERSSRINSVALRTNIGEALEVASDDFYGDRRFDNTHFILLTDGRVDIAADGQANARERQRILDDVVDRIRSRGATIHTIALSENADTALLERLAVETGGTFSVAPDADALNRVFAETLNAAAPQPEVPIRDNRFTVSDDVQEFTALIFHEEADQPLALVAPDGERLTRASGAANLRWYRESQYDLITLTEPAAGEWRIDGDLGEQSRVTVVSDLRMAVSPLPSFFYTGQPVAVEAAFYEKEQPITNPDFLGVLDVSLTLATQDGRSGTKPLSGETPPADGVYSDSIEKLSQPGTYDLTLVADGKTFSRQFHTRIALRPPVSVTVEGEGQGASSRYELTIRPEHPGLEPTSALVGVRVSPPGAGGDAGFDTVPYDAERGIWHKTIEATAGDGDYSVDVRFRAESDNGQDLNYAPGSFQAVFPRQGDDEVAYTSLSAETVTTPPAQSRGAGAPAPLPIGADSEAAGTGEPETAGQSADQAAADSASGDQVTAPDQASAPDAGDTAESPPAIDLPIDTSQVETPALEPVGEADEETDGPEAEQDMTQDEGDEPSILAAVPLWAWGTGGGVAALAAITALVMRSRRRAGDEEPEGDSAAGDAVAPENEEIDEDAAVATDEGDEEEGESSEPPLMETPEPEEPQPAEETAAQEVADSEEPDDGVPTLDIAEEPVEPEEVPVVDAVEDSDDAPSAEADEPMDDIEQFLEEARRDEADLAAGEDDILAEDTGEEDSDDYTLEDFDLSDIDDDLPGDDESSGESASPDESPEDDQDEKDDNKKN